MTEQAAGAWRNSTHVKNSLKEAESLELLNTNRPIFLLDKPTLCQVKWSKSHLQLVWLQTKEWALRREELDPRRKVVKDGQIFYKAYEAKFQRSVSFFDWNLEIGEAALLMHQLPTDQYQTLREQLLSDMSRIIDPAVFDTVQLHQVIVRLEKSGEVIKRNLHLSTVKKTEVSIKSSSRRSDIYSDPNSQKIRQSVGIGGVAKRGQFYWIPNGSKITHHIPLRVYPRDERFSLDAECTEAEVRHVLSGI